MNDILVLAATSQQAFASSEVCRITGVSTMQINHWDRLAIAKPSLRPADGTGSRRLYTLDDVAAVEVASRLRELNIPLECLGSAMRHVRGLWPHLADVSGKVVVLIRPDGTCDELEGSADPANLLTPRRLGILVDLAGIISDLRARLSLPPAKVPEEAVSEAMSGAAPPRASAWGEDW